MSTQMKFAFEMSLITNDDRFLESYSKFESKEEFNKHFEMSMADVRKLFTPLQHQILKCLRQFAVKDGRVGVANGSYRFYMEEFTKILGHEAKKDTIRRTIDKAESLGLLIKATSRRLENTSQTANVIVFNRYEEVTAYRLAVEVKEREELEKRLEEEYAANKQMLNWGHEAKSIAAARIQKKKEQQQKQDQEPEQQAAEQKPQTMYKKMRNLYKPTNKAQQKQFNELMAIVYGSLKRYKNKTEMTHSQLETILLNAFKTLLNKKDTRNQAAMLSVIIKKQMSNYLTPNKKGENASRNAESVPGWFDKYKAESKAREEQRRLEEEKNRAARGQIDYEKERERILKKLEGN